MSILLRTMSGTLHVRCVPPVPALPWHNPHTTVAGALCEPCGDAGRLAWTSCCLQCIQEIAYQSHEDWKRCWRWHVLARSSGIFTAPTGLYDGSRSHGEQEVMQAVWRGWP